MARERVATARAGAVISSTGQHCTKPLLEARPPPPPPPPRPPSPPPGPATGASSRPHQQHPPQHFLPSSSAQPYQQYQLQPDGQYQPPQPYQLYQPNQYPIDSSSFSPQYQIRPLVAADDEGPSHSYQAGYGGYQASLPSPKAPFDVHAGLHEAAKALAASRAATQQQAQQQQAPAHRQWQLEEEQDRQWNEAQQRAQLQARQQQLDRVSGGGGVQCNGITDATAASILTEVERSPEGQGRSLRVLQRSGPLIRPRDLSRNPSRKQSGRACAAPPRPKKLMRARY